MTTKSVQIVPRRQFNFSTLVSGTSFVMTVLEQIDVSQHAWGTLEVALHQSDVSGGFIAFDVYGDGFYPDETSSSFATATPLFPSMSIQMGSPNLLSYSGW